MKNLKLYIFLLLTVLLSAASCTVLSDETDMTAQGGAIVLHFRTPDVAVKGTMADNACESYMSHLDVLIYEYDGAEYTPFHYERVSVSATPTGKVSLHKTKEDFAADREYKFFVVANSTLDQSAYYKEENIIGYNDFLKLDQKDRLIHLSGVDHEIMNDNYPQMFLMDGVAYMGNTEPATPGRVVVNDPGNSDDVVLKVVLRRAAAKILITIIPGDKVTFEQTLMARSEGYLIRNMPNRTTLAAEGGYPESEGGAKPYWESTTISQSPYFQMTKVKATVTDENGQKVEVERDGVRLTAYCYSHQWEKDNVFEQGTSVVMMLPMVYQESADEKAVEYINNYYQLSITNKQQIKRNTVYDLRIILNAPGAEDITTPETIEDIKYFTAPWEVVDLPISGENEVKYLKVNKNKLYMYNISEDATSLYFSSSSAITVQYVPGSAYYYNKFNQKIQLGNSSDEVKSIISGSTVQDATSGNISVKSAVPTNYTIRYFQLKVTNQEGMTEIIDVEQYPLIYITNNLPWYSYRDDYYYRTTGGHKWNGNTDVDTVTGDSPTTYRYDGDHIVSVHTIDEVNVDTKEVRYTYTSVSSSSNNGGTGWTVSKVRGNKLNNSENYTINYYQFNRNWWGMWTKGETKCEDHNVRNYHVRMMASSKDYTVGRPALDKYGYTAGDEDNAKLVSPSFVIASRLGAVLSTYSGLANMSNDKKLVAFADHCKNYVEVDDVNDDKKDPVEVYDNWRLPTEAELKIIMDIQGGSGDNAVAIDFLLNGGYYMSASGPVYNHKNNDGTVKLDDPMQAAGVAIRCVRDAF